MGWAGGNEIFDPVARKVTTVDGISDKARTEILEVLVRELRMADWDTADESLEEFASFPTVVEAFRRNQVTLACGAKGPAGGHCEEERGHIERKNQPDFHKDWAGATWPESEPPG